LTNAHAARGVDGALGRQSKDRALDSGVM